MLKGLKLTPCSHPLTGELKIPGDKSISHRAVILGSLAKGTTKITHFLNGEDCLRTVKAFRLLGVQLEEDGTTLHIKSNGFSQFNEPTEPIYFGNSGTTARLMLGILAGLPFFTVAHGDTSLTMRPMDRVIVPLKQMGASFNGRSNGSYLPLAVNGGGLKGMEYTIPVKSAQVKSALLFAGLFADGLTKIIEPTPTRNHSENMLQAFGANLSRNGKQINIRNGQLKATDVYVPGDISSAAFFMAAAAIVPGSNLTLNNVGLNETRTGIIDVLIDMGASITITNIETVSGETFGDITIKHQKLKGTVIEGDVIPRLIDELPVIALIATQAEGRTVIRDAAELKLKETDRIEAVAAGLSTLNATIETTEDGMIVEGGTALSGGGVLSYNDHRIAMMLAIASLITKSDVTIDDISSIAISYPGFFRDLESIMS